MSIIPILSAKVVIRKLLRAGFKHVSTRGSHYIFKHPQTMRQTAVPFHTGRDIGRKLLLEILKQAGLSLKKFLSL